MLNKQLSLDAVMGSGGNARQSQAVPAPDRPGRITVPGKPSDDLATGTLKSIAKQSGIALP